MFETLDGRGAAEGHEPRASGWCAKVEMSKMIYNVTICMIDGCIGLGIAMEKDGEYGVSIYMACFSSHIRRGFCFIFGYRIA